MKTKTIKLLLEDWEYRKVFKAAFNKACYYCDGTIGTGHDFFFYGDRKSVCGDCHDEIVEELENE